MRTGSGPLPLSPGNRDSLVTALKFRPVWPIHEWMEPQLSNGGFPEPPGGEPVRVVRTSHQRCGGETRIRLSGYLPPRAVRRVICERCQERYGCEGAEELTTAESAQASLSDATAAATAPPAAPTPRWPRPSLPTPLRLAALRPPTPRLPKLSKLPDLPPPESPLWRWIGTPLAALAVVGVLLLVQGEDEAPPAGVTPAENITPGGEPSAASSEATFVTQPGFSLALPPGWEQTAPQSGAAFSAAATDGGADATLWIERAPKLSFAEFESRSLEQLRSLTGNAEVMERITAPTEDGTVVRLRADAPEETGVSAPYDVTLRAAGPFRYYLATTVQPGASRQARDGADLIHGSFIPEPRGEGKVQTSPVPGGEG